MNKPTPAPGFAAPAFVAAARAGIRGAASGAIPTLPMSMRCWPTSAAFCAASGCLSTRPASCSRRGMQIPHSVYLMDARGEMTNPFGRGYGDGDPDGTAWPIPGTLTPVWGEAPRAQMLMSLRDEAGHARSGRTARGARARAGAVRRIEADARRGARTRILSDRSGARRCAARRSRRSVRVTGVRATARRRSTASTIWIAIRGSSSALADAAAVQGLPLTAAEQGICARPVRSQSAPSARCAPMPPITPFSSSRS